MNSSPSAMVDVESSLSAAAEEEMACFPVATKPASDKMVAKVDSEEEDCGFSMMVAEDSSEEEVRPDRFVDSQVRDAWNARYARYFGRFEDTAKIPKKPRRKLPAEEEREHFQVETKPSDKMRGFAKMVAKVDSEGESGFDKMVAKVDSEEESGFGKMVAEDSSEELGPDHIFEAQASCFKETWEGLYSPYFGRFEDTTKIRNMRFTYKKPKLHESPVPTATLQIFSLKVAKIWGGLQWPLNVFGIVAVRDVVDHNRNMIFDRPRENCQILTQEDPYLKLTGPTRAVVLVDPVTFEVDLHVKGVTQDEDKTLSFLAVTYNDFTSIDSRLVKMDYASKLSLMKFELGSIVISVEATISLRVKAGSGSWPDGFRARIYASTASIGTAKVILLDSGDDSRVHVSYDGSIKLLRNVVSVEITGKLEVCVMEVSSIGKEVVKDKKYFKAKKKNVRNDTLRLGFCTLDVMVAWSLVSKSLLER